MKLRNSFYRFRKDRVPREVILRKVLKKKSVATDVSKEIISSEHRKIREGVGP